MIFPCSPAQALVNGLRVPPIGRDSARRSRLQGDKGLRTVVREPERSNVRLQWHDLKVRIAGNKVEGYLDGKLYLQHTLPEPVSGRLAMVEGG
jgi:hypothetical protein